ncbi:MAG: hypothetical protein HY781_06860 [Chloroflexi bacterium]|nr:hypothetical protein [Chloroflexota bacterium]
MQGEIKITQSLPAWEAFIVVRMRTKLQSISGGGAIISAGIPISCHGKRDILIGKTMKNYLINLLCCIGFALEVWLFGTTSTRQQLNRQIKNSLFLTLLFSFSIVFFIGCLTLSHFLWKSTGFSDAVLADFSIYSLLEDISVVPLYLWCGLSLFSLGFCLINRSPYLLPKKFRSRPFEGVMFIWGFISQVLLAAIVGITLRANYLARPHLEKPSSVYMLYENVLILGDRTYSVPEWVFNLGFYPIAEVSAARWGDDSIAVEPLSRDSLTRALQNGRLVFIASHGSYLGGAISLSPNEVLYPVDVFLMGGTGSNLQLVYIAGCNAGNLADEWQLFLAPAQVIVFDRLSAIEEHIYWLWFRGPKVVSSLR